jgi:hypothetical protein
MLVSSASELPAGHEWAFEVKWDGMRAVVSVDPAVRVRSRHGHDHTAAFPELAVLGSLAGRAKVVLDGDLVCLDPSTGRPSFERLTARTQSRLPMTAARQAPVTFMAFDVLAVDAIDLCGCPWDKRRQTLEELYDQAPHDILRVNTAFLDGPGLLAATAGMGLEGVVAKRVTSRYWPGRRTPYWRKVKHRTFEWFDLLGCRAPAGRDPGGLLAGRAGRVVACAFPALSSSERGRFAAPVAEHGVEVPGGVRLPEGLAEVEVGYLELFACRSATGAGGSSCPGWRSKLKSRHSDAFVDLTARFHNGDPMDYAGPWDADRRHRDSYFRTFLVFAAKCPSDALQTNPDQAGVCAEYSDRRRSRGDRRDQGWYIHAQYMLGLVSCFPLRARGNLRTSGSLAPPEVGMDTHQAIS